VRVSTLDCFLLRKGIPFIVLVVSNNCSVEHNEIGEPETDSEPFALGGLRVTSAKVQSMVRSGDHSGLLPKHSSRETVNKMYSSLVLFLETETEGDVLCTMHHGSRGPRDALS